MHNDTNKQHKTSNEATSQQANNAKRIQPTFQFVTPLGIQDLWRVKNLQRDFGLQISGDFRHGLFVLGVVLI